MQAKDLSMAATFATDAKALVEELTDYVETGHCPREIFYALKVSEEL
jgi:hypothetical protein